MKPGPRRIPAGQAPGGLVIQVYSASERLLDKRRLTPQSDLRAQAERAAGNVAALRDEEDIILVTYDGDTGERWDGVEWRRFLHG